MKDRTLKNQKKHINKTLKQFRLVKTMIQLSITGTVSVITASLSFYFCPGFSSQVIKDARSAISFVQTASGQKFHELEEAYGSNNGALYGSAIRDTPDDNGGGIHPGNPDSGNRSQ